MSDGRPVATLFSQWSGANAITQYSRRSSDTWALSATRPLSWRRGSTGLPSLQHAAFALILTLVFVGAYLRATKDMTIAEVKASGNAERASKAAIVAIYLHAVPWSIGLFSIPYLIGPGIFPTRIRSLNMSISMALHWAFYFGCFKAMPSLLAAVHRWGAFLYFRCIGMLGLIYVSLAMPDTTG
ncbi:hypothetical protein BDW60DRAFT_209700 [Aspergillus nidulans var. acristatus]